jgi:ADP-heptose:LPS heptosyltransferase
MPEAVVLQWSRLGDVLQSRVLLSALRRSRPELRRVLCLDARYAALARRFPEVDEVWPVDLARLFALARHPETQANLLTALEALWRQFPCEDVREAYVLSRSTAAVLFAEQLHPALLRGYRRDGSRLIVPDEIQRLERALTAGTPLPLHLADLWAAWCPGTHEPHALEPLTGGGEDVLCEGIGLLCDAGEPYRTIPREWLASLATQLSERFATPVYLYGQQRPQGSDPLSVAAIESFGLIRELRGGTDLSQLRTELAARELVIGPDTGALHLAAALHVPVIGLYFGGALAVHTGPYTTRAIVLQNPVWNDETLNRCVEHASAFLSCEVV